MLSRGRTKIKESREGGEVFSVNSQVLECCILAKREISLDVIRVHNGP
jgi:hypothetical protein